MSTGSVLPPEVWSLTLHNLRDLKSQDELAYLWTTLRHVCRQLKTEVEGIFRMEHLPKTLLHVHKNAQVPRSTQNGDDRSVPSKIPQLRYDSLCRYDFDGVHTTNPLRAVFSVRLKSSGPKVVREMIKSIETKTGLGRMGEADKSRPGSRVRLFGSTVGLALVQVRGGLHDCTLPSLTRDRDKRAISLDWRDLFSRFFGEKRMIGRVLARALVSGFSVAPSPPEAQILDYGPVPAYRVSKLRPSLQALGQRDTKTVQSYLTDLQSRHNRICRLSDPVHMWIMTAGCMNSSSKKTIHSCRLRRRADQEIYLDDEGAANKAKIDAQKEAEWRQIVAMKEEHGQRLLTCDACRERNIQCIQQRNAYGMGSGGLEGGDVLVNLQVDDLMLSGQAPCITCAASKVRCEFKLAHLNRGMTRLIPGGPPEQAYQERMILLDQQGKQPTAFRPR